MRNKIYLIAFFFLLTQFNAHAVGETIGDFSVSSTGGAQYTIPIADLPGVKNAVPNISLNYSSQSKNGIAGWVTYPQYMEQSKVEKVVFSDCY